MILITEAGDVKPRITAYQRQKEREDKRKKKLEKLSEKRKKDKKKGRKVYLKYHYY